MAWGCGSSRSGLIMRRLKITVRRRRGHVFRRAHIHTFTVDPGGTIKSKFSAVSQQTRLLQNGSGYGQSADTRPLVYRVVTSPRTRGQT